MTFSCWYIQNVLILHPDLILQMTRDRKTTFGIIAGIVTGISYGMNPLFAKPSL